MLFIEKKKKNSWHDIIRISKDRNAIIWIAYDNDKEPIIFITNSCQKIRIVIGRLPLSEYWHPVQKIVVRRHIISNSTTWIIYSVDKIHIRGQIRFRKMLPDISPWLWCRDNGRTCPGCCQISHLGSGAEIMGELAQDVARYLTLALVPR